MDAGRKATRGARRAQAGRGGRAAIATALVAAAIVVLAGCGGREAPGGPPPGAGGPPEVGTVQAERRTVTLSTEVPGQVEALATVEIRPQVSGTVTRIAYREGAPVARGDVLFEIDRRPFEAARDQARAALAQAEASVARSRTDVQRLEPLVAADAASRQELDNARSALAVAEATVLGAQAALRKAELDLGYTTVRAPIAGLAARTETRVGTLAGAQQTLLTTLYSRDPMAVTFQVGERDALGLRERWSGVTSGPGPTAKLLLADGTAHPHPARLEYVNAAFDVRAGTLLVRMRVPNPDGRLLAGQFVRVVLAEPRPADVIVVPQRAVQETLGQRAVMVVSADGTPAPRPVRLGARLGEDWVVEDGLKGGETVMVDGFARLRPGMKVKPVPAAGGAPAAAPATR